MNKTDDCKKFESLTAQVEADRIECLETVAAKLRERVKELTCLYGISQIISDPDKSFAQKIMHILLLLPPAWQYAARACARIIIDGENYQTPDFQCGKHQQIARICAMDQDRGVVEIHYAEAGFPPKKNPFLEEEQSLLNNVAGQIGLMIERRDAQKIKSELQEQLIEAARLSAIGQLAAGVAHELNEPLNTILGFAQLVQKTAGLPNTAKKDLKKITDASLHARSIIRELLIFARQSPHIITTMSLNRIVEDELSLLESMCLKSAVEVRRILDPDLPEIVADKSQMLQILSNLVVNAIQAMPEGGVLTIRTSFDSFDVSLAVEDTGIGMNEELKDNIFVPFFTTKDVDQGTGLGLAVVHGIVTSHGGRIAVESAPGQGSRFVVTLPRKQKPAGKANKGNDGTE
ncbi:MAG: ATP-binding protein [Desulfobacterales bacterium]|jgi:signal transduction histidine kinase|nr:ATP-binding protein [Desulfobacterales bacterium]MDD3950347.1 ATP-binding protein [Desulfobacterales bacterium]MDY0378272.1 ATP-binding protein [Desulfobacterales bacterium]